MLRRIMLSSAFVCLIAVLALAAAAQVEAKPPGGGGGGGGGGSPTPTGTVFVAYNGDILGIDPATTDNYVELPAGFVPAAWSFDGWSGITQPSPSHLDYGGSRWWITEAWDGVTFRTYIDSQGVERTVPQREVYAFRRIANGGDPVAAVQWVQLTDFLADDVTMPMSSGFATWSNDGQDSFVSFTARLLVGDDVRDRAIFRLHVTGRELDQIGDMELVLGPGSFSPFRVSDPEVELVFLGGLPSESHGWSPASDAIVYEAGSPVRIFVRPVGAGEFMLFNRTAWSPSWSATAVPVHGRERIAYAFDFGNIESVNTDGSDPFRIVNRGVDVQYDAPNWSPDANFLAVTYRRSTVGGNYEERVYRVSSAGGKKTLVNLTPTLDDAVRDKTILGWRSNTPAFP